MSLIHCYSQHHNLNSQWKLTSHIVNTYTYVCNCCKPIEFLAELLAQLTKEGNTVTCGLHDDMFALRLQIYISDRPLAWLLC